MKQAGRRDRLISIMRQSATLDDYGSVSGNTWTEFKQLWAELLPRGSRAAIENVAAYQLFPEARTVFIVDHPDPGSAGSSEMILHTDRVYWDGRQFFIQGFEEIGRRNGLRIYCTEKGDGIS
jgi:hypothetical protein